MNYNTMKNVLADAGKFSPTMSVQEFEWAYRQLAEEKEKEKIASVPLDKKIKYFRCWQKFVDLFGEKLSREALAKIDFNDIAKEEGYVNGNYPEQCGYEHIRDAYGNVEVYHRRASSFHRTERKLLHYYLTPNRYQHLKHEEMITYILNKIYPALLRNFKVDIYSIDSGNRISEIYVKIGDKTLYVPLEALMNKDINAIKKRNTDYQNDYYHDDKYCNDIFNHEDFSRFCKIVNG